MELKKQGVEVNPYYQNYVTQIVDYTKNMIKNYMHMRVYRQELDDVENIY